MGRGHFRTRFTVTMNSRRVLHIGKYVFDCIFCFINRCNMSQLWFSTDVGHPYLINFVITFSKNPLPTCYSQKVVCCGCYVRLHIVHYAVQTYNILYFDRAAVPMLGKSFFWQQQCILTSLRRHKNCLCFKSLFKTVDSMCCSPSDPGPAQNPPTHSNSTGSDKHLWIPSDM